MTADSSHFYEHIPPIEKYEEVFQVSSYHPFPDDWYVAVTDIINSTQAIQKGRYREVNIIGAAPIVGIFNKIPSPRIPFLFGGDGMMVCLPPSSVETVAAVLEETKLIAQKEYKMQLRTALFPLSDFYKEGKKMFVAKYKVSPHYHQAYFSGAALSAIDNRLKKATEEIEPNPKPKSKAKVQFNGLECRWKSIPSSLGVSLTLIVQSLQTEPDHILKDYEELISFLKQYQSASQSPLDQTKMKMVFNPIKFSTEAKLRTFGSRWTEKISYYIRQPFLTFVGYLLMKFKVDTDVTQWGRYTYDLVSNSDFRKMDTAYRQIISCTPEQAKEIEHWLETKWEQGSMVFGTHQSESSLVTCMVFAYQHEHIHFVDGNHGGYALAAKALKRRLEEK